MPPERHWHGFTEADCLDALRRAGDDLGVEVLRFEDYRAWRAAQDALVPAAARVVCHLGPWARAVRAARPAGRAASVRGGEGD